MSLITKIISSISWECGALARWRDGARERGREGGRERGREAVGRKVAKSKVGAQRASNNLSNISFNRNQLVVVQQSYKQRENGIRYALANLNTEAQKRFAFNVKYK
jgi:hypothetical protein